MAWLFSFTLARLPLLAGADSADREWDADGGEEHPELFLELDLVE